MIMERASQGKKKGKHIHFELNPPTIANSDPNTAAPMYNRFRLPSLSLRAAPVKAPVDTIISLGLHTYKGTGEKRASRGLVKDRKSKGEHNRCR